MSAVTAKRFTLNEYHRLGELGFFGSDDRVELIRGEIIQMPTKKTRHSVCNTRLVRVLIGLLSDRAIVRG
jgi:Uma2 family endonuclease